MATSCWSIQGTRIGSSRTSNIRLNDKGYTQVLTASTRQNSRQLSISCKFDPERELLGALFKQSTGRYTKIIEDLGKEVQAYLPKPNAEAQSLEETFMSAPDLETISYRVVKKGKGYEIRELDSYTVAEVSMTGTQPLDFQGSSKAFNTLAEYLFGSNEQSESMAMTTPVISAPPTPKMDSSKPPLVLSEAGSTTMEGRSEWTMSFVLPKSGRSGPLPTPKNSAVRLRDVEARTVAVAAFPGIPTTDEVKRRTKKLREALASDNSISSMPPPSEPAQIAQYNPPFTPPFMRRNEISLDIQLKL